MVIAYELPLNEVILDFYDKLKSRPRVMRRSIMNSSATASPNWCAWTSLLNGEPVDALSFITHKERAYQRGRQVAEKMKELIPKQMFEIAIQAAIGNKIIAALKPSAPSKKNVTAKMLRRRHFPQTQTVGEAEVREGKKSA